MTFRIGDRVRIKVLGGKPGRVVASQRGARPTQRAQLYVVRYEYEEGAPNRRSRTDLFFADELERG
jgi:hypothetical protein